MANQRDRSPFICSPASFASASASSSGGSATNTPPLNLSSLSVDQLIKLLCDYPSCRGQAIHALSKKRDDSERVALVLWNTPLVITILLQEVIAAYKLLSKLNLTNKDIKGVCDTLVLLKFVASHKETRQPFLEAKIQEYVYPFLKAIVPSQQIEFLKLGSLGIIGSLVQDDDPDVVLCLLEAEIVPQCLLCLEHGDERSSTLAAYIISKILAQKRGISYICYSIPRFNAVVTVMGSVVNRLGQPPSLGLLKQIIDCFLKLSTEERVRALLREVLPPTLRSYPIRSVLLAGDPEGYQMLQLLFNNIGGNA